MASIILRSVGSAIGGALLPGIGVYLGGMLGGAAGGLIDQGLGLGTRTTGPRLDNLSVQDSRYGAGIPIIYGSARVAGNVIWSTSLLQTSHTSSIGGGKGGGFGGGGGTETTYTYSVHCAVGITSGPIGAISAIWADNNLIYQNGVWAAGVVNGAAIYVGSAGQAPDPFMQSILGAANVPAYKGLAYIVFENLQLANFGNRLPNLTFEVAPAAASSNPQWLNSVDANVSQRAYTQQNGGMPPIALSGSGGEVESVLFGGYSASGAAACFEAVTYGIVDNTPVQQSRVSSGSFTVSTVADSSWALSPDGRFVAMYALSFATPSNNFVLYDTVAQQFGAVLGVNIPILSSTKQIAWIDAQHFVIDDTTGGGRGLHVFARAGLNIVDLGYWNVWGAGSATSRQPLFYAQFTSSAGGLLNYMTDNVTPYFSAIYARQINWNNNALQIGAPFTVASGLTPTNNGNGHANLVQTASDEWTLCFATFSTIQLISFAPSPTGAAVTRPWQTIVSAVGSSTTWFPMFYGDRLVVLLGGTGALSYSLSEILLNGGSFALGVDNLAVANAPVHTNGFMGFPLDRARFLLTASGGFSWDVQQVAVVERYDGGEGLDAIVGDILARSGYASGDYDVSALSATSVEGYILSEPMAARAAIEPLQVYAPFDLVESAGLLKAVPRHGDADVAIGSGEWRAMKERKTPPPALDILRAEELDLPREIDVDYIDPDRNFEINSQRARRIVGATQSVQKINLPIVADSSTAKAVAETRLFALWAERDLVRLSVSRAWLALDPGDVIDLGNGDLLRVSAVNQSGGLLQIQGFYVNQATYSSSAVADSGAGGPGGAIAAAPASLLYLLDAPLLQGTDDQPGVYAAATGLPGWNGAGLWSAADGVNYTAIASLPTPCIAGIAATALGNGSGLYPDNANSVNVQVTNGELSSCGTADLYNGANAAFLGGEIIQFQTATLIGPGLYTLSNLLRGRRGTESLTGVHAVGEVFVLLVPGTVDFVPALLNDRGATYEFRALSKGQTLGAVIDTDFTYGLGTLQPFSPVNLAGSRAGGAGSALTLVWQRRARLNAEWVSYIDVPLDEPVELYDVEIMNGAVVMRTFFGVTGGPTVTYTAAMQSADWGTVPSSFTVNVYQISSRYGRGKQATAVI